MWYAWKVKNSQITQFQNFILRWYTKFGRHELPWRTTHDPYKILVSELMLQQTQVDRVIPKYLAFLNKFPTIEALSDASLSDVLQMWQGLGYNRRAKYVWQTAQAIVSDFSGEFPKTTEELQKLPGIGPYTASAINTFAFNNPETVIETNIRAVYIHHFFPDRNDVSDVELLPIISEAIYTKNPREWNAALMDYGTHLKKVLPNPGRKSKLHSIQSRFQGSPRQVRGEIIRYLTQQEALSYSKLQSLIKGKMQYFEKALADLISEKMIEESDGNYSLKQ